MNARRLMAAALAAITLAATYLVAAGAAIAMPAPGPDHDTVTPQAPAPSTVITHTGSPWWTYLVVAIAASVLTVAAMMTITRVRQPRPRLQNA